MRGVWINLNFFHHNNVRCKWIREKLLCRGPKRQFWELLETRGKGFLTHFIAFHEHFLKWAFFCTLSLSKLLLVNVPECLIVFIYKKNVFLRFMDFDLLKWILFVDFNAYINLKLMCCSNSYIHDRTDHLLRFCFLITLDLFTKPWLK